MAKLEFQPGEILLAKEGAQLAKDFPQTAGPLYLTNQRLVLAKSVLFPGFWQGVGDFAITDSGFRAARQFPGWDHLWKSRQKAGCHP